MEERIESNVKTRQARLMQELTRKSYEQEQEEEEER